MSDLNMVALVGRIAKNAAIETASGKSICKFTIAVNRDKRDENGEYKSIPNFIHLALFGEYAVKMAPHLFKGRTISVMGELKEDAWTKDGKSYSKLSVVAHKIGLAFPLPVGKHSLGKEDEMADAEQFPQQESEVPEMTSDDDIFEEEIV